MFHRMTEYISKLYKIHMAAEKSGMYIGRVYSVYGVY